VLAAGFRGRAERSRVVPSRRRGRFTKVMVGGQEEAEWGTVSIWTPIEHIAIEWHPGRMLETAQLVSVHFTPSDGGTRALRLGDRGRAGASLRGAPTIH